MRIVARCECGKEYALKDARAGEQIRCFMCGHTFTVKDSRPAASEPVIVACQCGKRYRAKGDAAGKSFKCAQCGRSLVVPARDPAVSRNSPDPVSDSSPLAKSRAYAVQLPAAAASYAPDDSSSFACQCGERYPFRGPSGGTITCAVCGRTIRVPAAPLPDVTTPTGARLRGRKQYGGIGRAQHFFLALAVSITVILLQLAVVFMTYRAPLSRFGASPTPEITGLGAFLGGSVSVAGVAVAWMLIFQRYKNIGMNGWWGVLGVVPFAVVTTFLSLISADGNPTTGASGSVSAVIALVATVIPVLLVGFRCMVCPEGYADTKKLDAAGKTIIALVLGSPLLLILLAIVIALLTAK